MNIKKPIFILAPARSGTSIFYNLFTRHKDTAFPEHFLDKYWKQKWKFRLIPLMVKQQMLRYKIRPLPHEGKIWRRFHLYSSQLTENDVNDKECDYLYSSIKAELKAFNAKRFVDRAHDFMLQIRYLNKLFPDAYYIILERDPKAVINSLYTMMKNEWNPELEDVDTYGRVIEKFIKNKTLFEGCVAYYKHYTESMQKDLELIKGRVLKIKYENFIIDPRNRLKELYAKTGLEWYDELDDMIPKVLELKNNEKWKKLPKEEMKILEDAFGN